MDFGTINRIGSRTFFPVALDKLAAQLPITVFYLKHSVSLPRSLLTAIHFNPTMMLTAPNNALGPQFNISFCCKTKTTKSSSVFILASTRAFHSAFIGIVDGHLVTTAIWHRHLMNSLLIDGAFHNKEFLGDADSTRVVHDTDPLVHGKR
jgi:hypothetical protein